MKSLILLGEVVTPAVDLAPLKSALTGAITPEQILTILASTVGIGMTFFLMWFGVRKLVGSFTASLKNGKIKI